MDPISTILTLVGNIINKAFPDKTEKEKQAFILELQRELSVTDLNKAQINVNAAEAANPNLFVSGWRPAVGWLCVCAFGWAYLIQPILVFIATASGNPIHDLPIIQTADMLSVLMAMLGMAGLRTYEKIKEK